MILKIVSSGLTDVEKAALNAALKLNIPCVGRTDADRRNIGKFPSKSLSGEFERNVADSDGVLVFSISNLSDEFKQVRGLAKKHEKPFLHMDLGKSIAFNAANEINTWIFRNDIERLYATGREAAVPGFSKRIEDILEAAIYLGMMNSGSGYVRSVHSVSRDFPKTVAEAVERLILNMSLKDKALVANMTVGELASLQNSLGDYITDRFGLFSGNEELAKSCAFVSGNANPGEDEAVLAIIHELWKSLRETHKLRIVSNN